MKTSLAPLLRGLAQATAILVLAVALPTAAVRLFAAQPQPAPLNPDDFLASHDHAARYQRGLVLQLADQRCGCPSVNKQVNWDRWPTRCRPKNATLAATNFRPLNDRAEGHPLERYPQINYPIEYPTGWRYNNRQTIPFPGWPIKRFSGEVKSALVPWAKGTATNYRAAYKTEWGGTPPSSRRIHRDQGLPNAPNHPRSPWHHWQIHHILERHYGGTNHPMNLVPVFSRPNRMNPGSRSNLHNDFTQWWDKLTVDSDCRGDKVVWDKIKRCRNRAVVWPEGN